MYGQLNSVTVAGMADFDGSQIHNQQQSDPIIKPIYDRLREGKVLQSFTLHDDVVHHSVSRRRQHSRTLPYVPSSMIPTLLYAYHDSPTSDHLGVNKTWSKIRNRFFWPGMYQAVKQYVLSCAKCQTCKISRFKSTGQLQPIDPPSGILELMGMDFVGPVPRSASGNKYILVCTDYLSKYAITQATPNCTAETAARFLVEHVILRYGVPKQLLTDRGTHFMSQVFKAVSSRCGAQHITATAYHPQCNGLTERFNGTLTESISTYVNQ